MPITFSVDIANRQVYGFASGELTMQDMAGFMRQLVQQKLLHYRKLLHVVEAKPTFGDREVAAMVQVLREQASAVPRGPVAFVADPDRGDIARLFASLDIDGRPAMVFRSVHDARKWLGEQPVVDR